MNKFTRFVVCTMMAPLTVVVAAQAASASAEKKNLVDVSVTYSGLRTNAPVGGSDIFWMQGGSGELAIPVWRGLSLVGAVDGRRVGTIPNFNVGQSRVAGLGGVRVRVPTHTLFQPFAQAMVGGVHGFDSYFPAPTGRYPTTYDTSFAMTLGGGVDLAVSKHVWIRVVQADYFYTGLRNLDGNRQNQIRIGGGVVVRFPHWLWERQ